MDIDIDAADRTITSERLALPWMGPAFLRASLEGRPHEAEAILNAKLPDGWPDEELGRRLRMRLDQMYAEPASAAWLLRGMVRKLDGVLVGYVNFHGAAIGARAELGYTVLEPYRRQGYAREAALAMMRWAAETRGTGTFVVSISPDNEPSLGLAAALGFRRTGTQIDDVDGEEWVFELDWKSANGGRSG